MQRSVPYSFIIHAIGDRCIQQFPNYDVKMKQRSELVRVHRFTAAHCGAHADHATETCAELTHTIHSHSGVSKSAPSWTTRPLKIYLTNTHMGSGFVMQISF